MDLLDRSHTIVILYMIMVCKATLAGWSVKRLDTNRYELTKQVTDTERDCFELMKFVQFITDAIK